MSGPNIAAALVAAQLAVEVAVKDASNKHHGYDYASAEEIVAVGSAALTEAGLAFGEEQSFFEPFAAEFIKRSERSDKPYAEGIGGAHGILIVVYALVHKSGERCEIRHVFPVVPEKGRPLDKALAASRTECLAYALRGLLLMQRRDKGHRKRGKVPDVSGRNDSPQALPAKPGPQIRPAAAVSFAPAPVAQTHTALLAIQNAERGEDALIALSAARQDRNVDPLAAEDTFARWLVAKTAAAKTEETLTRIEGALRRASLGGKLTKETGEAITKAKCALGSGGSSG